MSTNTCELRSSCFFFFCRNLYEVKIIGRNSGSTKGNWMFKPRSLFHIHTESPSVLVGTRNIELLRSEVLPRFRASFVLKTRKYSGDLYFRDWWGLFSRFPASAGNSPSSLTEKVAKNATHGEPLKPPIGMTQRTRPKFRDVEERAMNQHIQ